MSLKIFLHWVSSKENVGAINNYLLFESEINMQLHFWGTRGSLPYSTRPEAIRKKIKTALQLAVQHKLQEEAAIDTFIDTQLPFDVKASYGCNTSCIEICGGSEFVICDAGSGLRDFGNHVMQNSAKPPQTFNIFISHLHWDHIHGFPFFVPAFIPGNTLNIYGCHAQLENAFVRQQEPPYFPLPFTAMGADIHFHLLEPDKVYKVADFDVTAARQSHPGDSYGYAFCKDDKKVVYSTDSEHQEESEQDDYYFFEFAKNADVLIFDAQYNLVEHFFNKHSWGHSCNIVAVELAVRAKAKRLCLFHNEHTVDDHQLEKFLDDTRRYLSFYAPDSALHIDLAYDGLNINLTPNAAISK